MRLPDSKLRVDPAFFRVSSGRSSGILEKLKRSAGIDFKSQISLALRFDESYVENFPFTFKKEKKLAKNEIENNTFYCLQLIIYFFMQIK